MTYRRSLEPNNASAWAEPEAAGSGTYPTLVCGADGTLYLTLRSSKRWDGVDLYVKSPDQPWRKQCKFIVRDPDLNGYGAFHNGLAWGADHKTLHLVQDFYESKGSRRGVHQAVCYMQSRDGGQTWQRADGTPVALPARFEDMDVLARSVGKRPLRANWNGCNVAPSRAGGQLVRYSQRFLGLATSRILCWHLAILSPTHIEIGISQPPAPRPVHAPASER